MHLFRSLMAFTGFIITFSDSLDHVAMDWGTTSVTLALLSILRGRAKSPNTYIGGKL